MMGMQKIVVQSVEMDCILSIPFVVDDDRMGNDTLMTVEEVVS